MFGLLNVNKPRDVTSRDVVNQVQQLIHPVKVGHAGTLDPLATGVLVLCVGPATRLIPYVQRMRKRYRATFLLGRRSDTDDVSGAVEELPGAAVPTRQQIEQATTQLLGTIQQRPPDYSAVKLQGERAYRRARRGQPVEIAPRSVTVYSIDISSYAYPQLVLDICCGSGTYVRALGRDLAAALGTAAVMSALERTAIGQFRSQDAVSPEQLDGDSLSACLLPATRAVADLPRIELNDPERALLASGQFIRRDQHGYLGELAAVDRDGQLAAILTTVDADRLRATRNFAATRGSSG